MWFMKHVSAHWNVNRVNQLLATHPGHSCWLGKGWSVLVGLMPRHYPRYFDNRVLSRYLPRHPIVDETEELLYAVLWNNLTKKLICFYVATLFRFVARFARVGILNSRPGGSHEVLVNVSELGFPFYSILLTVALLLCSYVVSIYFYLRIKC